jgi:hypothetical protein
MILIKLQGGLGNQMFQYALGRSLSTRHNKPIKFDCTYLETPNQSNRSFELGAFNLNIDKATSDEIADYCGLVNRILDRIRSSDRKKCIVENTSEFDPTILEKKDGYFEGHWNSEKYFKHCENVVRKDFKLKKSLGPEALAIQEKIGNYQNSVSVHVRRGDYVTIPKINLTHGTLPISYYQAACRKILETSPDAHFFVSSDDINWTKENFPKDFVTTFVSSPGIKNHEELALMSLCKHNIIANSTFSWWAAWLNENPNKIVIAPSHWFANPKLSTADLIPPTWIKM